MGLVHIVDLLAKVAQTDLLVTRLGGNKFRQDSPHWLILVVVVLELLQGGQQRVPATFGDADGEHDEERVQAGLLHDHTMLGQELGEDGGGYAGLGEFAGYIQPRCDDGRLDRVEHIEARRKIAEAMPFLIGSQGPVLLRADTLLGQLLRSPHLEPPVLAEFGVDLAHGAAEIERLQNRLLHQGSAARGLHHRRRHIATGDDRVLR